MNIDKQAQRVRERIENEPFFPVEVERWKTFWQTMQKQFEGIGAKKKSFKDHPDYNPDLTWRADCKKCSATLEPGCFEICRACMSKLS